MRDDGIESLVHDDLEGNEQQLVNFKYKFNLENGVKAALIFDSHCSEQSVINYDYNYTKMKGRRNVELVIEQNVHAHYIEGIITDNFNVTYHIINPSNLGKIYFLGVDISTDSKVFLDISYKKNELGDFCISEIRKGIQLIYSADSNDDKSILSQIVSPLDIETVIKNKSGYFEIPLAMSDSEDRLFITVNENHSV